MFYSVTNRIAGLEGTVKQVFVRQEEREISEIRWSELRVRRYELELRT